MDGNKTLWGLGELIMAEAYHKTFSPWEVSETTKGSAKEQLDCHTTGTVARYPRNTRQKQLVFHMTVKPLSTSSQEEKEGSQTGTHKDGWKRLRIFILKTATCGDRTDKKGKVQVPQEDPHRLLSYDCYVQEVPLDMGIINRAINRVKDKRQPMISAHSGVTTPTPIRRELRIGSERPSYRNDEISEAQTKGPKRVHFTPADME